MTTLKLLSAGLMVSAMIASPAMAREGSNNARRTNDDAYASVQRVPVTSKRNCVRAPDVGAYASDPWRRPPCEPKSGY
ncbi:MULTISPECIES: hypothetical protein [Bradyrhizobium]|jgi:hypothetical protein|uniref:Uncharacterized protein n=1 Tax=Bradyrhizobium barranii subsp. barranii TaxID=2823807 RepID=A0A7Z0QFJ5_9BRAD|nr:MULTISPECIES: hypothetical protein [Bradyrhizobium]MCK1277928.1 hypothetical protein [Bradyrhizobium sp. 61]MCK1444713.1 hypothetical protein [Bradyrhizobium sp. 48]MCK1462005.1 hypothetical protein [Bradyrhizobium sp. 2]UGX90536.1 hypothetical protein G6321_00032490 [Bradyrhizobium barranii subsp. barranii]